MNDALPLPARVVTTPTTGYSGRPTGDASAAPLVLAGADVGIRGSVPDGAYLALAGGGYAGGGGGGANDTPIAPDGSGGDMGGGGGICSL